jgi:hypothetical protein
MVRFIFIGGQITEGNQDFAWYDTVTDEFISFAGRVVFDSWDDFEESHRTENSGLFLWMGNQPHIERFRPLFHILDDLPPDSEIDPTD